MQCKLLFPPSFEPLLPPLPLSLLFYLSLLSLSSLLGSHIFSCMVRYSRPSLPPCYTSYSSLFSTTALFPACLLRASCVPPACPLRAPCVPPACPLRAPCVSPVCHAIGNETLELCRLCGESVPTSIQPLPTLLSLYYK